MSKSDLKPILWLTQQLGHICWIWLSLPMERIIHSASDFSDLISSCSSIRRCLAVPVDCIIIIVKRHEGMGKCVRAYAGSRPAWVFLNRHLSYAGSVRLTVGTVMWAKHLYCQRKLTDMKQVYKWQEWMLCIWCLCCYSLADSVKWPQSKMNGERNKFPHDGDGQGVEAGGGLPGCMHSPSCPGTPGSVPDSTISVPGLDFRFYKKLNQT